MNNLIEQVSQAVRDSDATMNGDLPAERGPLVMLAYTNDEL